MENHIHRSHSIPRLSNQFDIYLMATLSETPTVSKKMDLSHLPRLGKQDNVEKSARAVWPGKDAEVSTPLPPKSLPKQDVKPQASTDAETYTESFYIPSSARSAIIGPKGYTLRQIQNDHKVTVALGRTKTPWILALQDVKITGNSRKAIEEAKAAILKLVTFPKNVSSSRTVPANVEPFVKRDALEKWNFELDADNNTRVLVRGSFQNCLELMAEFDSLVEKCDNEMVSEVVPKPERFGKSVLNLPKQQLLSRFGAALYEKDDGFVIVAPPTHLAAAVNSFLKSLNAQVCEEIDLCTVFSGFAWHAKMLTRYFKVTRELGDLEKENNVSISPPSINEDGSVVYSITGETSAVKAARNQFLDLLEQHSPANHVAIKGMRYPLCRAVARRTAKGIKDPIAIVWSNNDELYVVHKSTKSFSKAEIREDVLNAVSKFATIDLLVENMRSKALTVTDSHFIQEPLGDEAVKLLNTVVATSREDIGNINDPRARVEIVDSKSILLTGNKESVAKAAETIPEVIKLCNRYTVLSSYSEEFPFDVDLLPELVGKGGSQINQLRSKYEGVKIEVVNSGRVVIQGLPLVVREASSEIKEMQKRLRDIKTEEVLIPTIYLPAVIGRDGRNVRKLTEKYECTIKVPSKKSERNSLNEVDGKESLSINEKRSFDTPITLKGPSKSVSAVKREILGIVQYERDHSVIEILEVDSSIVPRILGRGGSNLNRIRIDSRAEINVSNTVTKDNNNSIQIKGSLKQVNDAAEMINSIVQDMTDHAEVNVPITREIMRLITTQKREEIITAAGGDMDNSFKSFVIVPGKSVVRISGTKAFVKEAKKLLNDLVEDYEDKMKFKHTLTVPGVRVKALYANGNQLIDETSSKFDVTITFGKAVKAAKQVLIYGRTQKSVEDAAAYLTEVGHFCVTEAEIVSIVFTNNVRRSVSSKFNIRIEELNAPSQQLVVHDPTDITTRRTIFICGQNDVDPEKCKKYLEDTLNCTDCAVITIGASKISDLIGRNGDNIKKLRKNNEAVIELNSDKAEVYIYGSKETVQKASEQIKDLLNLR